MVLVRELQWRAGMVVGNAADRAVIATTILNLVKPHYRQRDEIE
jgi:hypothetical protein